MRLDIPCKIQSKFTRSIWGYEIKGYCVGVAFPASKDQIKSALNFVQFLEPSMDREKRCLK